MSDPRDIEDSPLSTAQHDFALSVPSPVPDYIVANLRIDRGKNAGVVTRLREPVTIIGRATHAHVRLTDDGISREHFSISFHAESREFRVNDMGSANGTRLNGSRVSSYALRNGDKILAGETMLVFERESSS